MRRSGAWLGLLLATSGFGSVSVPNSHPIDLSVSNTTNAPMLLASVGHTEEEKYHGWIRYRRYCTRSRVSGG